MKITVQANIEIPTSRRSWELYDMPGAGTAARELTSALRKAIKEVSKGATADKALYDVWYPVARKNARFGATDSEPRWHAEEVLQKAQALVQGRS